MTVSSRLFAAAKIAGGSALVLLAGLAGVANGLSGAVAESPDPTQNGFYGSKTVYSPPQALGDGAVHTLVTTGGGAPVALGVRVTETALATLPAYGNAHGVHETDLTILTGLAPTPFDHVSFDWQPQGHKPDGVYALPHFDVHFYMMTHSERDAVDPDGATFAETAAVAPRAPVVPVGYVPTPDAFARMGVHWVDLGSLEFTPAGFSRTFIHGFWNRGMNFLEPMVMKTFVESVKTMPGQSATFAVPQPAVYERAGCYPIAYGMRYDAEVQAYDLVLKGLTLQSAPVS